MHYRLRSIEGGQFRFVSFASHFIRVQIFQIDFPLILSVSKYFTAVTNITSRASGDAKNIAYSQNLSPFLMIRRPPRSTRVRSSAASDVYKRQVSVVALDYPRSTRDSLHSHQDLKLSRPSETKHEPKVQMTRVSQNIL